MAARVPAKTIAALLGLPRSESGLLAARVYGLARALTPVYPIAQHDEIEAAADLFAYVEQHLRTRQTQPRDDLLSTPITGWRADPVIPFRSSRPGRLGPRGRRAGLEIRPLGRLGRTLHARAARQITPLPVRIGR